MIQWVRTFSFARSEKFQRWTGAGCTTVCTAVLEMVNMAFHRDEERVREQRKGQVRAGDPPYRPQVGAGQSWVGHQRTWRWPSHWPACAPYQPGSPRACPELPALLPTALAVLPPGPGDTPLVPQNRCRLPALWGTQEGVSRDTLLAPTPLTLLPTASSRRWLCLFLSSRKSTLVPCSSSQVSNCSLSAHSFLGGIGIRWFPVPCLGPALPTWVRFLPEPGRVCGNPA